MARRLLTRLLGPARPFCRAQVRACAFKLLPSHSADQLQRLLPFVGRFTAGLMHELLATGSCAQLRAYLQDQPVKDSRGNVRLETTGARAAWPPPACMQCLQGACSGLVPAAGRPPCCAAGPSLSAPVRRQGGRLAALMPAGAHTRMLFCKIPGVGSRTAARWYDMGYRWGGGSRPAAAG